ncbi:MAG: hypothetical protein J6K04_01115 [Lachnospiraceae bacterium]|nr:hypothetical protein [Lachnospiraceae bacterium]
MQEHIAKHIVKSWIDNSNWSYQTKRDLKFIVDVSRTCGEMTLNIELYLICLKNYWQYKLSIM